MLIQLLIRAVTFQQHLMQANELAVAKFLDRKIKYLDIPDIIEYAMNEVRYIDNPSVDEILETEQTVYEMIENRLKNGGAEWL